MRIVSSLSHRFRLQYVSNLYITRHEKPCFPLFVQPAAPHLAIVGNVGHPLSDYYSSFFAWAANRWHSIIYIPGDAEGETCNIYEILKHHQNVFILTKKNPFYIYEPARIALWTPVDEVSRKYRKLFALSYDCIDQKTTLAHHGTIYSHGLNGANDAVYTNTRGHEESPEHGFSTKAVLTIPNNYLE